MKSEPVRRQAWVAIIAHVAAIFFAAFVPAIAFGALQGFDYQGRGLAYAAFVVAMAHALLFGLPAYLTLRTRLKPRIISSGLVGFCVGALPVSVLLLATGVWSPGSSSSVGGVPTMVDGHVTGAGLIGYLGIAMGAGGLGALGGLAFGIVLRCAGVFAHRVDPQWAPRPRVALGFVTGAVAVVATILSWSFATRDQSCHNPMRDGRSSISAMLVVNVDLPVSDWGSVSEEARRFASSHQLELRDEGAYYDHPESHDLSLCSDAGMNISVSDWRAEGRGSIGDQQATFTIMEPARALDWRPFARDLVLQLRAKWPGRVRIITGEDPSAPPPTQTRAR